ncbi:unnamed protein product [Strongylus vulgaris]|uniref:Uncharacterized protein n=1 Tax=Strongylus vulgaris TaxID=40348 RepID=A0A3P7IPX8_STRVU|nr:unnamed protein product [Strongylus vulgaris]
MALRLHVDGDGGRSSHLAQFFPLYRFNEERLAMLAERSALERERQEVQKEKQELLKNEQLAIINKGGAVRPPIKFSFGKSS